MPKASKQEDLQRQITELTDALQRERADALNARRRFDEHLADIKSFAKADVLKHLLPALDNLDRALKHVPKELTTHDYVKGVQGLAKQFEQTLAQLGIQRIKTLGEPFNPHTMEAMSTEGEGSSEVVVEELQPGYMVGDKVIRHAMVRVKMEQ